ncbi:MAG: zinc metallopeptidase [Verrucomicrobia bacterium]|nr:zinc metallopeptidase [Prolixibacteraceae bacterium]
MLFKGRRQSGNVLDFRGGGGPKMGFRGGIIGTLVMALIIWILGGNPMSVLTDLTGGGSEPTAQQAAPVAGNDEMGEFVRVVLADTEDVWNKIFSEAGETYREPTLVLFSGAIRSACGNAQSSSGPFYCPGDERIYIDLDYLQVLQQQLGAQGDFAAAYIIAHEVGHHVQKLLGTLNHLDQLRQSGAREDEINEMSVRTELQADFLAGVWVHHGQRMKSFLEQGDLEEALNAAAAVGDDKIQMATQGSVHPDSFTHGTAAQRKAWLQKGIETGDVSQGNTFR